VDPRGEESTKLHDEELHNLYTLHILGGSSQGGQN
jgi:hypothetical protein